MNTLLRANPANECKPSPLLRIEWAQLERVMHSTARSVAA